MKSSIYIILILVLLEVALISTATTAKQSKGSIHVVVNGVDRVEGQIGILLFESKDGFPTDRKKAYREVLIPLETEQIQYTFHDLPYGQYAISVMHDNNMNDELDANIFGIPKEGVGTSNNVKSFMRAPKFDEASIVLDSPNLTTTIKINY